MDLKREIRVGDLSPQARIGLIVVLGVLALGLGLFMLTRSHAGSATVAPSVPTTPAATPPAPAKPLHRAVHRAAVTPTVAHGTELPSNVAGALGSGKVVVVALYAPNVGLDELELREAQAGATEADATFTSVDVTSTDVNGLAARYSALHDPTVLVLKPSGDLAIKLDGFADKETVAQAAASASQ
jgi:hypothetical protein